MEQVFNTKDLVSYMGYYLSPIEIIMLSRVLNIKKPNYAELFHQYLISLLGPEILELLDDELFISGSVVLKFLTSADWENGDIDFYCSKKGFNRIRNFLESRTIAKIGKIKRDKNPAHTFKLTTTAASNYINYNGIKIQIIRHFKTGVDLFDFDFLKNTYNGQILRIKNPFSVVKKECMFDMYLLLRKYIKITYTTSDNMFNICKNNKLQTVHYNLSNDSQVNYIDLQYHSYISLFDGIFKRYVKYTKRGFNVLTIADLVKIHSADYFKLNNQNQNNPVRFYNTTANKFNPDESFILNTTSFKFNSNKIVEKLKLPDKYQSNKMYYHKYNTCFEIVVHNDNFYQIDRKKICYPVYLCCSYHGFIQVFDHIDRTRNSKSNYINKYQEFLLKYCVYLYSQEISSYFNIPYQHDWDYINNVSNKLIYINFKIKDILRIENEKQYSNLNTDQDFYFYGVDFRLIDQKIDKNESRRISNNIKIKTPTVETNVNKELNMYDILLDNVLNNNTLKYYYPQFQSDSICKTLCELRVKNTISTTGIYDNFQVVDELQPINNEELPE